MTNLQGLMSKHSLTVRETAQKAGLTDFKRFYRWASIGISRATHEHDADLEKLRSFFGLSTRGQFWNEPDEEPSSTNDDKVLSIADILLEAGKIEREYDAAYKLIVVLKSKAKEDSDDLCDQIDELFREATEGETLEGFDETTAELGKTPEEILEPKTPEQIIRFLRINQSEVFNAMLRIRGSEESIHQWLERAIQRRGNSKGLLKIVLNSVRKYTENEAK